MVTWLDGTGPGGLHAITTTRAAGDLAVDSEPVALAARRRGVVDRPWVWLRQVHGGDVVVVTGANEAEVTGFSADALVTVDSVAALSVQTADCLPIVLHSAEGVAAVVHAGWRGLQAGVVERAADAMRGLGATEIGFVTGPCIGPECYEFGGSDLDRLASQLGDEVRGTTRAGTPALDLRRTFEVIRRRADIGPGTTHEGCTSCAPELWYSHRARAETARMATVVWRGAPAADTEAHP